MQEEGVLLSNQHKGKKEEIMCSRAAEIADKSVSHTAKHAFASKMTEKGRSRHVTGFKAADRAQKWPLNPFIYTPSGNH